MKLLQVLGQIIGAAQLQPRFGEGFSAAIRSSRGVLHQMLLKIMSRFHNAPICARTSVKARLIKIACKAFSVANGASQQENVMFLIIHNLCVLDAALLHNCAEFWIDARL